DVGFPGPEHQIAEREWPMKAAMAPLALLAIVAGALGIPGVTETLEHFLEPTFEHSHFHDTVPTEGEEVLGLIAGGVISLLGIGAAALVYLRRPGTSARLAERFAAVHALLCNKWYFDELYEVIFVRPWAAFGRFGRTVVESTFVQGVLVGGTVGIVRAGSSFARAIQTGDLRGYAALLIMGVSGLVLYFLVVAA
ncbi:MAG: NADH-quinone oxidoreductase subunit L, partial [Actinomycetota bacterium]|nr:NADH-quinone oxidoreductase subunit L [Actinomycetota bacterium]